jgi:hypothetical protein
MSAHDTQPDLRKAFPDGASDDADTSLLNRLELHLCDLRLTIEEYRIRGDLTVDDYPGPDVLAVVFGGRAAVMTPSGREVRRLTEDGVRRLHALAHQIHREPVQRSIHTELGHVCTRLTLHYTPARGLAGAFVAHVRVNHGAPRTLTPAWTALLCAMRDPFGPGRGMFAEMWDRALTWSAPTALGAMWDAGHAVVLPHIVTAFETDGPIYLRTGQPLPTAPYRDVPSVLYRFDGTTLTCVDRRTTVAPILDQPMRWELPCGGGTLAVHTNWDRRRIVIRADDTRGIYVQRDS